MKGRTKRGKKPAAAAAEAAPPAVRAWKLPAAPEGLGEFGTRYWTAIGPQLVEAKVLVPVHAESFATMCRAYDEYRRFDDWLRESPDRYTFCTEKGYELESPQVRIRDKALSNLLRMWAKFGLTPLALVGLYKLAGMGGQGAPEIEAFAAGKYEEDPPEPD